MDNKNNLITSAIAAFSLYFLLIALFLYYSKTNNIKKINIVKKPTVLQLDIIIDTSKVDDKKVLFNEFSKNKKTAKKVVKKSTSSSVKKRSNLKSLFADVKTNVKKVSKKRVSTVKKSSISSRFKSKFEKERKVDTLKLSKLANNKQLIQNKNIVTESKNESDPYLSEITRILSSRWNPTIFNNDLTSKVLIYISSNGNFSYQFVQYSDDMGFDEQLKNFLDKESLKIYPINPKEKSVTIELIFKAKLKPSYKE
ncbi:MAG: TonB C-terminal domain-containing protein [Campylobacterota bacterium]|nr:TonB C-terminal domain-containing protein [Campylobacterota bacterium]